MKFTLHKTSILLLSLSFMVISSCRKKDDKGDTAVIPPSPLTCKVNGNAWASEAGDKTYYILDDTINGTTAFLDEDTMTISAISINGSDTSGLSFYIVLDSDRLGAYTITSTSATGGMYFPKMTNTDIIGTLFTYGSYISGSIQVTTFDPVKKTFSGTFNLSMDHPDNSVKDYILTEGQFNNVAYE